MISYKKWGIALLIGASAISVILGAMTIIVDPCFHYHSPLKILSYPLFDERHQNDGIVKHFSYNAIITGTSVTQNFKKSEFDEIFGVDSIKVSFPGARYKEINDNLKRAIKANSEICIVLRGLDTDALLLDKDAVGFEDSYYPDYLYDDLLYNDVKYILNKSILFKYTCRAVINTVSGESTDFDAYGNWMGQADFGKEAMDKMYVREKKSTDTMGFTNSDYEMMKENLEQNVVGIIEQNPQIDFYLFFPPYSIYYWDDLNQKGALKRQLEAEQETIKILLQYDNVYLFSFFDEFDMICDLSNYKDNIHYGENINSKILLWISNHEHMLTKENYKGYVDEVYEFYTTYDYDSLFLDR